MASRTTAALRCFAVLAVLTTAAPAFADPSAADKETARSLMEDGDGKRDKGDLKGALKAYEAADAIMKVPTTGFEVAKAQSALGQLIEARETALRVTRIPPKPGEPPPFTTARKNADALSNELGARIPSVQISVVNAEPGATPSVTIDNDNIPAAALAAPRKVNPGPHVVVVKAGSAEKREEFSIAERENKTVTVDLKPAPVATTTTDSGSSKGGTGKVLMIGGFALGAIGIGVGSVTGLMSISKTDELKPECPNNNCPPNRADDVDSAQSLGNISTVMFIVGAVGIGVGVVGLVMSNKGKDATAAIAKPTVRPILGGTYYGLGGTF